MNAAAKVAAKCLVFAFNAVVLELSRLAPHDRQDSASQGSIGGGDG